MICTQCHSGFLVQTIAPKPVVLSYRGFSRLTGAQLILECTFCCNELTEPCKGIDIDREWCIFKREINSKLSGGDEL